MKIFPLFSLIAACVCYFFAFLVLFKDKKSNKNRSFFLATILTGIWTFFPFLTSLPKSEQTAFIITKCLYFIASFVPVAWYFFMLNLLGDKERKKLLFFTLSSLVFAFLSLNPLFIKGVARFTPSFSPSPGPLYFMFIILFSVIFGIILLRLYREFRYATGYRRSQLIYVGWAYVMGAISGTLHFISAYTNKEPIPHDIFLIMYPCVLAYAILKYRLMDISVTFTRTGIFIAVYTLVLGSPFVLAFLSRQWLISILGLDWWIGPLVLMGILATVGPFIYIYLQKRAEAILLREQRHYQETLKAAAMGMTRIRNLDKLLNMIVDTLINNVRISHAAIYLARPKSAYLSLEAGRNLKESQPATIEKENDLVGWLEKQKEPLIYEEIKRKSEDSLNPVFKKLENQMLLLNAMVIVSSFLEDKLLGIIIMGEKSSGKTYTSEDLHIFSVLASEAALAIENALLYGNIEDEVKQRTKELVDVQKQLVQAEKLATVGTLAGGVAHEINNPLAAILTNVQMLLSSDTPDAEFDRESLELIEEATKRCRTIVQKLMVYARRPMDAADLVEVDLAAVVNNTVAFLRYQLEQENIHIAIHTKDEKYTVTANHNELEQVITNIVLNARDAIRQVKRIGLIEIALSKTHDWINIQIKDNGIGMTKEVMARIFDPFFTTKDVGKGLGLGLSICQSIVEKYSGKITVHSEPDKGASFTVQLPVAKQASGKK